MDCLDRTNVSQSALGKWALNKQLREVGVLSVKETIEDHPEFMSIFRNGQLSPQRWFELTGSMGGSRKLGVVRVRRYWRAEV